MNSRKGHRTYSKKTKFTKGSKLWIAMVSSVLNGTLHIEKEDKEATLGLDVVIGMCP